MRKVLLICITLFMCPGWAHASLMLAQPVSIQLGNHGVQATLATTGQRMHELTAVPAQLVQAYSRVPGDHVSSGNWMIVWVYGPQWDRIFAGGLPTGSPRSIPSRPLAETSSIALLGTLLLCSGILLKRTFAASPRQAPETVFVQRSPSWKVSHLTSADSDSPMPAQAYFEERHRLSA
ncbi:MAG: hypothetical protein ACP5G0_06405 [Desulfomonilia bacterium]